MVNSCKKGIIPIILRISISINNVLKNTIGSKTVKEPERKEKSYHHHELKHFSVPSIFFIEIKEFLQKKGAGNR